MIAFLRILDCVFVKMLHFVALGASAVITLALVALVICRYVLNYPLSGMHEMSILAALWLYMTGAMLSSRNGGHLVVDLLESKLTSTKMHAFHALFISALTVVITAFFAFWVWKMLVWGIKRPQTIPVLNLPLWLGQLPLGLAAITAIVYGLRDTVKSTFLIFAHKKEEL